MARTTTRLMPRRSAPTAMPTATLPFISSSSTFSFGVIHSKTLKPSMSSAMPSSPNVAAASRESSKEFAVQPSAKSMGVKKEKGGRKKEKRKSEEGGKGRYANRSLIVSVSD